MKHLQISYRKSNLPWFSCGYRKCMFVDFLTEYVKSSQLCSFGCRVVTNIWRHVSISFFKMTLWCLLFDPHLTTYQGDIRVRLRKLATYDPSTLHHLKFHVGDLLGSQAHKEVMIIVDWRRTFWRFYIQYITQLWYYAPIFIVVSYLNKKNTKTM